MSELGPALPQHSLGRAQGPGLSSAGAPGPVGGGAGDTGQGH